MRRARRRNGVLSVVLAVFAVAACRAQRDTPKEPLPPAGLTNSVQAEQAAHALLGPAAKAALDSGNVLFRQKAYAGALAEYRSASGLAPQHAAPLFGIYMVARATNDTALADSAMAGIRARTGSMTIPSHAFADTTFRRLHGATRE